MASRSDTWMLTSTVRNSSLASIMRTGISATATPAVRRGLGLQQFGVAGEVHAGGGERLLVQRRGDQRRHVAAQRGARGPDHGVGGEPAGGGVDAAPGHQRPRLADLQQRDAARRHSQGFVRRSMTRDRQRQARSPAAAAQARRRWARSPTTKQPSSRPGCCGTPWR
jgi:hypothetical protein